MAQETTLILFKPDCMEKHLTGEVLKRYEDAGYAIRGMKMMRLEDAVLREHYAHIADKPFYPEVQGFMQSTPVIALALSGEDVVAKVRDLLGPTDSTLAPKGSIRGDLGENKMRNICHASDSVEAAEAELKRFFKADELF
jgi:nucleoside-diphosphate kinase